MKEAKRYDKIFKQTTQAICIDLKYTNSMIIQLLVLTFQDYLRKNDEKFDFNSSN